MRAPRSIVTALPLAATLVVGCGSSGHDATTTTRSSAPVAPTTSTPVTFPKADGRTLQTIIKGLSQGPQLAPTVGTFEPGTNRIGFVLLDRARNFVNGASVALYVADSTGAHAQGPFPARSQSLAVSKPYQSDLVSHEAAAPRAIYSAMVPMGRSGRRVVIALTRLDGRMVATTTLPVAISKPSASAPPTVGDKAIKISTQTVADVSNPSQLDTRIPPATALNQVDFAKVLGKKPIVLLFATPKFCQSRTCGPVEDIIDELAHTAEYKRFAWVHVEIYKNNNPGLNQFRPQVTAYRLQTEPWLFVIDSAGTIRGRFEGAFGSAEVRSILDSVH